MREIKFRAWNDRNSNPKERMMELVHLTNLGLVIMPDGDTWALPVMQFTGLRDKNGKEIFEGDILHLQDNSRYPLWGTDEKHPVVFDGGAFRIDTMNIYELLGWGGYSRPLTLEIIGNIYENPELLQK